MFFIKFLIRYSTFFFYEGHQLNVTWLCNLGNVLKVARRFAKKISLGIVKVPAAISSAIKESGGNVITQQESVALSLRSIRPVKNRVQLIDPLQFWLQSIDPPTFFSTRSVVLHSSAKYRANLTLSLNLRHRKTTFGVAQQSHSQIQLFISQKM